MSLTWTAVHSPPLAVWTPLAVNARAIPRLGHLTGKPRARGDDAKEMSPVLVNVPSTGPRRGPHRDPSCLRSAVTHIEGCGRSLLTTKQTIKVVGDDRLATCCVWGARGG